MGVYALAIGLPWLSTLVTDRNPGLRHQLPFALQFVTIIAVGRLLGFGPAIAAGFSAAWAFNWFLLPPRHAWSLSPRGLVSTAVTLLAGLAAGVLSRERHTAEDQRDLALASLRERTDALTDAQQGSRCAAWVYTVADDWTRFYPGGAELFGVSLEELSAKGTLIKLVWQEDWVKVRDAADLTVATGAPFHVEFRVTWPNGEIRWLEARGTPLPNDRMTWRGVTIDITERKKTEAALVRSEKLAAVGRLASTLAHEINNPLEAITNLLYLAAQDSAISPAARSYLQLADQELRRLAGITRLTLSFVRAKQPEGPCGLAEIAASVVALFSPSPHFSRCGDCVRASCVEESSGKAFFSVS